MLKGVLVKDVHCLDGTNNGFSSILLVCLNSLCVVFPVAIIGNTPGRISVSGASSQQEVNSSFETA